jgi:hypothetical protein
MLNLDASDIRFSGSGQNSSSIVAVVYSAARYTHLACGLQSFLVDFVFLKNGFHRDTALKEPTYFESYTDLNRIKVLKIPCGWRSVSFPKFEPAAC